MDEAIRIEGNEVLLIRGGGPQGARVERRVALADFLERLRRRMANPAGKQPLLPTGTRWYGRDRHTALLALEEGPRRRTLAIEEKGLRYHLAFPYIVYIFLFRQGSFEEMKIFYRKSPLEAMDDTLLVTNLLNVQAGDGGRSGNRACLRPKPDLAGLDVAEAAVRLISHFWSTTFNRNIGDNCFDGALGLDERLRSLERWERESADDPLFVLSVDWKEAGLNFGQTLVALFAQDQLKTGLPKDAGELADLLYEAGESDYYILDVDDDSIYPI